MVKKRSRNLLLKKLSYLFLLLLTFLINDNIKAYYMCGYGGKENMPLISYIVSDDNKISFIKGIEVSSLDYIDSKATYILDFEFDEKYEGKGKAKSTELLIDYFKGRCQKTIYYCHGKGHTHVGLAPTDVNKHEVDRQGILFAQQYQGEANTFNGQMLPFDYGDNNNNIVDDDYINFSGDNGCVSLELVNSSNAEVVDFLSYDCSFLIKYFKGNDDIKSLKSYYDLCKKGNSDACLVYNNNKNIIKTYCYSTIEHSDYNNPCVYECSEGVSKKLVK